jgi:hypothetical protein
VFFERPVVNLLSLQTLACHISIFSLQIVGFSYVIGIPSLGGGKHGLLVVSENKNFKRYEDIALIALRDIYIYIYILYVGRFCWHVIFEGEGQTICEKIHGY